MSDDDRMLCSSCDEPKHELLATNSRVISSVALYMCNTCMSAGYEPRWIIIMAARTAGVGTVRDYIVNRKYVGKAITAHEVI